jgi:hypothetical protein
LLLHYRSLCRELYVQRPTIETNELLREADRGKSIELQEFVQGLVSARKVSIEDTLKQLESDKATCDQALSTKAFSILNGAFVHFRKTPSLACAGYTQPTFDFAGNEVHDITDMSKPLSKLSFTLLPDSLGGIAVFSWLPSADAVCRPFVKSFMALDDARKSDSLVQYVFDSCQNFAAEPTWWEGLSDSAKDQLKLLSLNDTDLNFRPDGTALIPNPTTRYAEWEVDSTGWL